MPAAINCQLLLFALLVQDRRVGGELPVLDPPLGDELPDALGIGFVPYAGRGLGPFDQGFEADLIPILDDHIMQFLVGDGPADGLGADPEKLGGFRYGKADDGVGHTGTFNG